MVLFPFTHPPEDEEGERPEGEFPVEERPLQELLANSSSALLREGMRGTPSFGTAEAGEDPRGDPRTRSDVDRCRLFPKDAGAELSKGLT